MKINVDGGDFDRNNDDVDDKNDCIFDDVDNENGDDDDNIFKADGMRVKPEAVLYFSVIWVVIDTNTQ